MTPIIVTKSELMAEVIFGRQRECFVHSTEGIFDITAMREQAAMIGELHSIDLDLIIPEIEKNRVIDEQRVAELDIASWRDDPGIFLVWHENLESSVPTVLMVDGHHRAMRRYREGFHTIRMWFIESSKAIRPGPGWIHNPYVDWGDQIVDGKIVRRQ